MSLSSFLSGLFYKQKHIAAPSIKDKKKIYINDDELHWDKNYMLDKKGVLYKYAEFGVRVYISSKTIDLGGCVLYGARIPRSGNVQDEKASKIKIDLDGWTIKNGYVADIPGGLYVISQSTEFKNLVFVDIGEDAISTPIAYKKEDKQEGRGTRIIGCKFYNRLEKSGGDKTIQLNNGTDCVIRSCYFTGGITSIRVGSSKDNIKSRATIKDNVFEQTSTAINGSGVIIVLQSGNRFIKVKKPLVKGPKAKFTS